jgi:hypothetical protein
MTETGRRPYRTTDGTPYGVPSPRIRPPPGLPEPLRKAFVELVASVPAEQFKPSDVALIVRWIELQDMVEEAAAQVRANGLVDADGEPSAWFKIHLNCTKALSGLALRLKLSPQSRSPKAPKREVRQLSYYEQLALEEGESDDENRTQTPS